MLILARREGEQITLFTTDGPIQVTLALIEGTHINIGIMAPQSVHIVPLEVTEG